MRRKAVAICFSILLVLPALGSVGRAQDASQGDSKSQASDKSESSSPKGLRSFADDALDNAKHHFVFSIGVFETYESNVYYSGSNTTSASATAISPRLSVNFGGRKSHLHIDYGINYRIYNGNRSLDNMEHYGNLGWNVQLSRRVQFQINDQLSSSMNGYGSLLGSVLSPSYSVPSSVLAPTYSTPVFSGQVFLERQRITTNFATATLSFQLTRKANLGLFAGHQYYMFQSASIGNTNGVHVGVSLDYQINKWLSLSNSYSTYLGYVDSRYRDSRIHRLQVGGLNFKLSRGWQISASGGIEYTKSGGRDMFMENVDAGIQWHSQGSQFGLNYHRGFFSSIGLYQVMSSQQGTASFGTRLTSWMNYQISASYTRANSLGQSGALDFYMAHSGLDVALMRGLIASLNGQYLKQRTSALSSLAALREAYTVYLGLQYVFPNGRR